MYVEYFYIGKYVFSKTHITIELLVKSTFFNYSTIEILRYVQNLRVLCYYQTLRNGSNEPWPGASWTVSFVQNRGCLISFQGMRMFDRIH